MVSISFRVTQSDRSLQGPIKCCLCFFSSFLLLSPLFTLFHPQQHLFVPPPKTDFLREASWLTPSWLPSLYSKVTFSLKSLLNILFKIYRNKTFLYIPLLYLSPPDRQSLPTCLLPASPPS